MRINGPNTPENRRTDELATRPKARSHEAGENRGSTPPSEHVTVSSKAQRLADVRRDERVHDADKIERLKQALQTGNFKVNPHAIAARMLKEES